MCSQLNNLDFFPCLCLTKGDWNITTPIIASPFKNRLCLTKGNWNITCSNSSEHQVSALPRGIETYPREPAVPTSMQSCSSLPYQGESKQHRKLPMFHFHKIKSLPYQGGLKQRPDHCTRHSSCSHSLRLTKRDWNKDVFAHRAILCVKQSSTHCQG